MEAPRPLWPTVAVLSLLSACAGAGGDTGAALGDPCLAGDSPALTVGKGELSFSSLEDDPMAELIHGPQGGYHVNLALQAVHMEPEGQWTLDMQGRIDGTVAADNARYVQMRCNRGVEALQVVGVFLIFDSSWEPEDLDGETVEVDVTAIDAAGTSATDTATLTIFDPNLE